METMFAILIAAGLGVIVRYASRRGRDTYGVLLVPAVAAVVTAIVWEALLWLGWTFDGTWIWVVGLLSGPLVALIVALTLPRRRVEHDRTLLRDLSHGRA
ncbi:hypothetical protein QT381_10865 [Galbitalea sp. SE-J8]|uniref:hypothetical protein n=1 Tax=Galbitalea sp. SE-J8 TaxID=3054952 RepID=UPI00259CA534|nr:hypothetical protein [Galbitalea sp. SE-J8]MDM4763511.1 hypothetical protein [Galbitalea sp. SE-J8]